MVRLTAGKVRASVLPGLFAAHVATLTGLGLKQSEAETCFHDAMSVAEYLHREGAK